MKLTKVNKHIFEVGHGIEVTPVGMNMPDTLNEDQWNEVGDQVIRLENASNWILGDWWAFGQHRYGERKKWLAEQRAKRAQVKSFQSLVNIARVCRAFETNRRRLVVSFQMHSELAKLPEAQQDKFLDQIEAGEIKGAANYRLGELEKALGRKLKLKGKELKERLGEILSGLIEEKQNVASLKRVSGKTQMVQI